MKKSELSTNRQQQLVPVTGYSGAFALVPPPTPRSISSKTVPTEVTRAHEAHGALTLSTTQLPNPDLVTRTLDRREAVRSSQIEGTRSEMDELLPPGKNEWDFAVLLVRLFRFPDSIVGGGVDDARKWLTSENKAFADKKRWI